MDACRVIPSLLKAYKLTGDGDYLEAAKLAGGTFLKTMQDQQPHGGFARAVDEGDNWLLELDVECLYGLIGLKMLAEKYDVANAELYRDMMERAVGFLREGFEGLWLWYSPADGKWHRVGLRENHIYDDCLAYALLGLYEYEGWSSTCQKVYGFINSIGASAQFPLSFVFKVYAIDQKFHQLDWGFGAVSRLQPGGLLGWLLGRGFT
ncbi:MAG: hypothetical protein QXD34_01080 [Candidatus Bathyarchaeia archaeon]